MAKTAEALVRPEILIWARNSAKLNAEMAAKKAGITVQKLEQWESGESRPTVNQLRLLGRAYKRPIAVFYLPEPPSDYQAMHDFRRLPAQLMEEVSPELAYELRRGTDRRDIALELTELGDDGPVNFSLEGSIHDDPEELALRIRSFLGVSYETQAGWAPGYDSLYGWRTALEDKGILVFQFTGVQVTEARGFSISDTPYPVIRSLLSITRIHRAAEYSL